MKVGKTAGPNGCIVVFGKLPGYTSMLLKMLQRLGLTVLSFVLTLSLAAQDFSNKGKEFWLAYSYHVGMVNVNNNQALVMTLYITADVATTYSVEVFGGAVFQAGNISAGQVATVTVPNSLFIDNEGKFTNKAIRLTASEPVVVYAYITRSAASSATLCLPTPVLGREYFASSFTQVSNESNSNSYITIVAVEDNTTVEITPTARTKNGWLPNTTYSVTLNKGEIYQVLGAAITNSNPFRGEDLTGTRVRSVATASGGCKRIAVFSGSGKILISANACNNNTSDNLYQQLYPVVSWGMKYLTVPSYARQTNVYRVMKSDPATNVYVNGSLVPAASFVNNQYYQFFTSTPNMITADKPISVAQYFTTQNCDGNPAPYDPNMIMLNPVEQNIDQVTLVNSNLAAAPTQNAPHQHHIHVVMRNGGTGISSFTLDGAPVAPSRWVQHPEDPSFSYLYLNNVSQGYHRIASDSGFNALAYGYANAESYGYSAGANVKDLYQFVSIKNEYATVDFPAACASSPFQFRMTFPYQPAEIKWIFGPNLNAAGLSDQTQTNPAFDSTWIVNGKQLYRYTLAGSYAIATPGSYPIKVRAVNATSEGCTGEQEIEYTLQVFGRPVADFNFTNKGCVPEAIVFNDASTFGGRPAIRWNWAVSDGRSSNDKNPALNFTAPGTYDVSLSVITDIGCVSAPATKQVNMFAVPQAAFNISSPLCAGKPLQISDASTTATGNITEWNWTLGDGATRTYANGAPFTYSYATAGTYTLSLNVKTDQGCASTLVARQVQVNPDPQPGFIMPGNCLADPFTQFTDTTRIAGSASGMTYLWNFGDANANASNPNTSTQQHPRHRYAAVGNYNVSLTTTSAAGCTASITQVFTINGAQPSAAFNIARGNTVCSNKVLSLQDASGVDFGNIVKLEIYWDYANDPTNKSTVTNPGRGGVYTHTYPEFFSPASLNRDVQVIAYSGDNCFSASTKTVSVLHTPDVYFNTLQPLCADAAAFQINSAGVRNTIPGSGVFSGKGVGVSGQFAPAAAGAGIHSLTYTYTGSNGCVNTSSQTIEVFPVPVASAGPDRFVLEGGSVNLAASASGRNLSYLWTPATALSSNTELQPAASPADDITYRLLVTSSDGCTASDEVFVKVLKAPTVPNVFTPNGDGINDTWVIKYIESYPGATIKIFNRFGQPVFESKGYARPWDGTYNGKPLPAGTYYYIIDPKNGRKQVAGFVDLIR